MTADKLDVYFFKEKYPKIEPPTLTTAFLATYPQPTTHPPSLDFRPPTHSSTDLCPPPPNLIFNSPLPSFLFVNSPSPLYTFFFMTPFFSEVGAITNTKVRNLRNLNVTTKAKGMSPCFHVFLPPWITGITKVKLLLQFQNSEFRMGRLWQMQ